MHTSVGDTIKEPILLWNEEGNIHIEFELPTVTSNLLFLATSDLNIILHANMNRELIPQ